MVNLYSKLEVHIVTHYTDTEPKFKKCGYVTVITLFGSNVIQGITPTHTQGMVLL